MDNNDIETTGTTILAFKYKDGIMFAADSRTTRGQFISCHYSDKITQISENVLCCRSGVSSHTQYLQRIVARECQKLARLEQTKFSIRKAANILGNIIYENKDYLRASLILGGHDNNGFEIYKIAIDGTIIPSDCAVAGSGSAFIYGYVDTYWKPNMELKDALDFALQVVRLAINRDVASGGVVRVATLENNNKVTRYMLDGNKVFLD